MSKIVGLKIYYMQIFASNIVATKKRSIERMYIVSTNNRSS